MQNLHNKSSATTIRNDNLQIANDDHHVVIFLHDDRQIIILPLSPFNDVSTIKTIYFLKYCQKIIQIIVLQSKYKSMLTQHC